MGYPFDDDHGAIRAAARSWLEDWYRDGAGPARVAQSGPDRTAWHAFGGVQGFAGIAIDEKYGGAGLGPPGQAVILEETGRTLFAGPFFGTCCLAADMIGAFADGHAKADLFPKIVSGQMIVSLVDGITPAQKSGDGPGGLTIRGGQLFGRIETVLDAHYADWFIILVPDGPECRIIAVQSGITGLAVETLSGLDTSFSKSMVTFDGVDVNGKALIGCAPLPDARRALAVSCGALGALCVGGAQRCLDMTLAYTGQRVQFDRPVAGFQAVKHRCADMFEKLETARSAAYYAAGAPAAERYEAALIAKAWCADAYFRIAADAIQLHGGIGFTWDYPLHYFFKQAGMLKSLMGSTTECYDLLSDEIGLAPEGAGEQAVS